MKKRKKKVVYKSVESEEQKRDEIGFRVIVGGIGLLCIVTALGLFFAFPLVGVQLPAFYLSAVIWVAIFLVILVCGAVSLLLVANQGANKKLYIYFLLCGITLLVNLAVAHIFHLFFVSLFLSAVLIYLAFLTFHELHKTNLSAYYLFIPFILFSIYNAVVYYFVAMLN